MAYRVHDEADLITYFFGRKQPPRLPGGNFNTDNELQALLTLSSMPAAAFYKVTTAGMRSRQHIILSFLCIRFWQHDMGFQASSYGAGTICEVALKRSSKQRLFLKSLFFCIPGGKKTIKVRS